MSRIVVKRVSCGILWIGKRYAVYSDNSRNENIGDLSVGWEVITVRAFQVAPVELEGVLLSHPNIIDAAGIGIKLASDDSEFPRAYIIPRAGARLTEEQVMAHVEERLAKYKRLEGDVKFIDSIPKNASGKILKNALREQAARN